MFNFGEILGKFQDMQRKLEAVKTQLDDILVEAEAGGGMVRVTANANRKVLKIAIDPDVIDKNDPEILEDLIVAAVNRTLELAEARGREEMQKITQGLLPPGFDLGKLGLG
jgi:hypothetical protein